MADDLVVRLRKALGACPETISWRRSADPARTFADLAEACREFGIDEWEGYAEHGAVEGLEQELITLLDKPAAAFFPSGEMAQQVAHARTAGPGQMIDAYAAF